MPEVKEYPVYGDGVRGVVVAPARFLDESREKLVRLNDGAEFMVPADALEPQPDGSFYLRRPRREESGRTEASRAAEPVELVEHATPAPAPEPIEPAESVAPPREDQSPPPPSGDQLFRRGYSVRHVPVERILDEPAVPRQEGETMIYPVMEEVLVVEKKLMLKEEIHVTPEQAPIGTQRIELDRNRAR
jgi:hypothetical protein